MSLKNAKMLVDGRIPIYLYQNGLCKSGCLKLAVRENDFEEAVALLRVQLKE